MALLLGEPEAIGYGELQGEIGRLLHGEPWETREIPKALAKAGAWVQQDVLGEDAFIRPWMVDIAEDHYAIDITRARNLLGWEPQHSLRGTLPRMIDAEGRSCHLVPGEQAQLGEGRRRRDQGTGR